jgi:hypothetical protein
MPKAPLGGGPDEIAGAPAAETAIALEVFLREIVIVSAAEIVWLPAVSSVAEKFPVPLVIGELGGRCAWLSLLVNWTVPE